MRAHRTFLITVATFLIACAASACASRAWAEDAFYRIPLDQLEVTEGKLPESNRLEVYTWGLEALRRPYAIVEGGEAYISTVPRWSSDAGSSAIVLRGPAGQNVTGTLYVPAWATGPLSGAEGGAEAATQVRFVVKAAAADPKAKEAFYRVKENYYQELLSAGVSGSAWFRHEMMQARKAVGPAKEGASPDVDSITAQINRERGNEIDETFGLFSGGRALSENIQLDRLIPSAATTQPEEATVDLSSLTGITTEPMDWKARIKDLHPATDALAALVPADQHAVFFPTFEAMTAVIDEADRNGTPVLDLFEPRSEDAQTKLRYQKQLCLSLTGLGRVLGPQVIQSIAMTGSDPYLRAGSDVAIIFEAKNVTALQKLLDAQVALARQANPLAQPTQGDCDGVPWTGARSPDRSTCTFIATLGNAVAVTNSPAQLQRLVAAFQNKTPALAGEPEFIFFRNRYPLGDAEESGFVILTDAAIRRWCSPRWRIADSRRTRADAVMAALQADAMDKLAAGEVAAGPIKSPWSIPDAGELTLTPAGIVSSVYGSLEFMTPIAELSIEKVTRTESGAYWRWRRGYQNNWQTYFDPIAIRFGIRKDKLAADVSVIPLIAGTEYRQFIEASAGAKIAPGAADPHGALLHLAVALNTESSVFKGWGVLAGGMIPGMQVDPLGWIGQTVSLYVDDDPVWEEAAKAEKPGEFFENNLDRLPIALRADAKSALKLTAFLAGIRGFIEQTAPGMTQWQSLKYKDQPYVKITGTDQARKDEPIMEKLAIYYAATPRSLLVTLSQGVLERALDRQIAKDQPAPDAAPPATRPWLGENLCMQADARFLGIVKALGRDEYRRSMQLHSWSNIPILNEWKRLYPDQDPVKLHERFWQTRLVCPGGGQYAWNEKWHTMESTVYGCPAAPKQGPAFPTVLDSVTFGNLGISFEEKGLRGRVVIERAQ